MLFIRIINGMCKCMKSNIRLPLHAAGISNFTLKLNVFFFLS